MCDRLGLLVQDEAFDEFTPPKNKWIEGRNVGQPARFGYGEIFLEWSQRDLQDMVRRDRNHPSVIMWSIGNEIDYANDPFSHPVLGDEYHKAYPRAEQMIGHGERLVRAVKALDPTRPVTAALAKLQMSNEVGFPELLDVVGYNYQENRYAEDHRRYPRRVIYGSENDDAYEAWRAVADNDYIAGQFLWTGFDYLGEAGKWPSRVFPGGLADLAGFRKPLAWWRQALWAHAPMVYLAASQRGAGKSERGRGARRGGELLEHWNWSDAAPVRVMCCTNCPTIDLYLNGKLVHTLNRDDERRGWRQAEIDFQPGALEAVGRDGDKRLCNFKIRTAGQASAVRLEADAVELAADGHDVVHVTFTVVDENGVCVPDAKHEVTFAVNGPVKILGIDNGRTEGEAVYQDERCTAYRGRGLAILQSQRESGTAVVRASAPALRPAEISLTIKSRGDGPEKGD
jgi:beta-galactosidase